jgi:hypothetical protein
MGKRQQLARKIRNQEKARVAARKILDGPEFRVVEKRSLLRRLGSLIRKPWTWLAGLRKR